MQARRSESGFTLIELMLALVVTLVVSGAIFGLLSSGQGAFQREPEVTDVQQNLRAAMDLVMRDVEAAGTGIPTQLVNGSVFWGSTVQVFGANLGDGKACNVAGTTACPRPTRPYVNAAALPSTPEKTDDIALFLSNSECGPEPLCAYNGNETHVRVAANYTCADDHTTPMFFMADGTWTIREITRTFDNNGGNGCPDIRVADVGFNQGTSNAGLNDPAKLCGNQEWMGTTGNSTCTASFMLAGGEFIGYRIALGTDGVPNLERRSTAAVDTSGWQNSYRVVARGIEDMQVEYALARAPQVWLPDAPTQDNADNDNYDEMVTAVRVTLSGRGTTNAKFRSGPMTGVSRDALGRNFIRASLTSTAAVRSALLHASRQYIQNPTGNTPAWN